MNPRELRIGNVVGYKGNHPSYDGTFNEEFARHLFDVKDEWDLLYPVTITDNELERRGFQKTTYWERPLEPMSNDYIYVHEGKVRIGICNLSDREANEFWTDFEFMHQLQNIFYCLTGLELEHDLSNDVA